MTGIISGNNGKCSKEKWVQIDGKYYYFGDTGAMETGWILDDMYYCDDVGVMVTGWKKLTPPEEYQDEDKHTGPFETASDGQYWYYFGTNGKKTVPSENGTNIKQKRSTEPIIACARTVLFRPAGSASPAMNPTTLRITAW